MDLKTKANQLNMIIERGYGHTGKVIPEKRLNKMRQTLASIELQIMSEPYPSDFKHIEREWNTQTHHHWIENFADSETGEIIQIERKRAMAKI